MSYAISIHALRVEGDSSFRVYTCKAVYISIHALRVEGDVINVIKEDAMTKISIHALRVEGDLRVRRRNTDSLLFLSTPSGWRVTVIEAINAGLAQISIHALRVEGDTDHRVTG